MDTLETIQTRYSVRGYKPDPVDDETLTRLLEAARQAPTAANRQAFRLIVLHTRGREEEIGRIYKRPWFVQAPLVIGVVA
ncbi:MAG: nitroreductase family protein, partial [Actinomycetes bacterium]